MSHPGGAISLMAQLRAQTTALHDVFSLVKSGRQCQRGSLVANGEAEASKGGVHRPKGHFGDVKIKKT